MPDRPADLPVAAPDHALTEREREWLAAMPTWTDVSGRAIAGKADALLAERQQDKERIERLTEKLELLTSAASERASLSDKATSSENLVVRREATRIRVAFVDAVDDARAALAVEGEEK